MEDGKQFLPDTTQYGDNCRKLSHASRPSHSSLHSEEQAAPYGVISAQVARDIRLLREFDSNRQRQMRRLFGRRLRPSPLRDELLRLIMLIFAEQRCHRVAFYVHACAAFATGPSVRGEIENLICSGLIVLTRDNVHSRAVSVRPTQRLVAFYNEQMRRLREEVMLLAEESRLKTDFDGPDTIPCSIEANYAQSY